MKNQTDLCYWCGNQATTQDHVPAKGFLKKQSSPKELLTVPSCKSHNNLFSGDEEWLRNYMTAISHDQDALDIWSKRSFPSLKRNKKLLQEMRENMVVLSNNQKALRFSKKRARHVIQKIVRGLFFHMFNKPLGKVFFRYYFNPKVNLLEQFASKASFFSIQNGVFQWAVAAGTDDPGNAIWWLEFHRSNLFIVAITREPV